VTVKIDYENNAEEFWAAFAQEYPKLRESDPETFEACKKIAADKEVELLDAEAIQNFTTFVESLPGFTGGPKFAPTALIFQAQ
jgi:hypothetical protein